MILNNWIIDKVIISLCYFYVMNESNLINKVLNLYRMKFYIRNGFY